MFETLRIKMVEEQIIARGVKNKSVINAMKKVERHLFVPEIYRESSYIDGPISIGNGQTISQPYIVAYMTELSEPKKEDKVLEIGTGSGYQAAILAEIVNSVYTVEIIESLGKNAKATLGKLDYKNIFFKIGDGYKGWAENSPFDIIIVTAAPPEVPQELIKQLDINGRMIVPVGPVNGVQSLLKITKDQLGNTKKEILIPVRFVPMVEGNKWKNKIIKIKNINKLIFLLALWTYVHYISYWRCLWLDLKK